MIDQDLLAHLKALATPAGERVHIDTLPQDTVLPAIAFRHSGGGNTPKTLDNVSLFTRANIDIEVLAKRQEDAYPVAIAIKDSLHGYRGAMGASDVQSSRCVSDPSNISSVDGDKVFRGLIASYLIVHR
jgi:hypothetical protein